MNLHIVWASDSGAAFGLAGLVHRRIGQCHMHASLSDITEIRPADLSRGDWLFIVSTWGAGDPPTCAYDFWTELLASDIDLSAGRFILLGLGNARYSHFAGWGHALHDRLSAMDMQEIVPALYCESTDTEQICPFFQSIKVYYDMDCEQICHS